MNDMGDDRLDNFVDAQLRYLRGVGPRPDLSELDEAERLEVQQLLEIVDALADSLPASPVFEEDPVAIRLGLVDERSRATHAEVELDVDGPVHLSMRELAARFDENALRIERLPEPLTDSAGNRAYLICRSLAEAVAVVVFETDPPTVDDAAPLFRQRPELSAVALSNREATQATVVTPSELAPCLVPSIGWRELEELIWEPLGIALGRHFEQSMPRWDRVMRLTMPDALDDVFSDAAPIVEAELDKVARSRPQLAHKKNARDFVAGSELSVITDIVGRVRARRLLGEDLTRELAEMCEASP